jgi:TolB-like protein
MRGFIEELRYRNVFRVAIAYVVAGWLVAQVVDLASDAFNAPDWVMQMLIVVLLIGLPVALFLAWAYELTPDGVKRAKDLPEDAPKDPRSGKFLNRITIVTLVIAVAWLGWDKAQRPGPATADIAAVADKSIAVLPFDDFSPGGDQAWFADGLTEEILNSLARTPDLHVASRTSSFVYRDTDRDVKTIAGELEVAHILEGSVRRAGDQLRVTAQLIRAADDKHLWSETFDGSIENSIAIQEEIAIDIANALQTAMDPAELARMVSAGTASVEAWETYLRGLALKAEYEQRINAAVWFDIAEVFDEAVRIDPSFVDAYKELANLWWLQLDITTTIYASGGPPFAERRELFEAAQDAWRKLARDEADRLRAETVKARYEVRLADLGRLLERIVALDPEDVLSWMDLGEYYLGVGEAAKAYDALLTVWSLRHLPEGRSVLARFLYLMRLVDIDEAVRSAEERLAEEDVGLMFYYQAHRLFLRAGMPERAANMMDPYLLRSDDEDGKVIIRVRQACAEGRVDDADAIFSAQQTSQNIRWLFLKTLGFDDEARELLREYDAPDKLFILAGFLDYLAFEPRDYPLLWKTLLSQGIERPPATPIPFRCRRDA